MKDSVESCGATLFDAQFPQAASLINFVKTCVFIAVLLGSVLLFIIAMVSNLSFAIPIIYTVAATAITYFTVKFRYLGTQKIYFDSKALIVKRSWLFFSINDRFEHRMIKELILIDKEFWNFFTGKTVISHGHFARLQINDYPVSLYFYPYQELHEFIESYWIGFLKNKKVIIKKAA